MAPGDPAIREATERNVRPDEVAVIVPAAGSGSRMGGTRKQLRLLGDAPVLVQTLRALAACDAVTHLVVVGPADMQALLADFDVPKRTAVVPGGATRQDSVACGLAAVPESTDIVLVHDGVRPFVTAAQVNAVIAKVQQDGAAALAIPVADTLRRAEGGRFGETVERADTYRMQTPQGARADWFRAAHRHAADRGQQATDEVALLQAAGYAVHLVEGSDANYKLTRPEDWARALKRFD